MTDAPREIWATPNILMGWDFGYCYDTPKIPPAVRYIRADAIAKLPDEESRLRDILMAIEIMTATGMGLSPDETMDIHILAAEGRSDDPHAWRADPDAIQRLRSALHATGGGE